LNFQAQLIKRSFVSKLVGHQLWGIFCCTNSLTGQTLKDVIPNLQELIGNEVKKILADAGYRGQDATDTHSERDRINAILASAGYNFRLLLNWLRDLLCPLMAVIFVQRMDLEKMAHPTGFEPVISALGASCLSAKYLKNIARNLTKQPERIGNATALPESNPDAIRARNDVFSDLPLVIRIVRHILFL
jgi:hypothetical protein